MYSSIRRSWALVSSDSPHDASRELDRDLADLAPELLEHPIALGSDLFLGTGHARLRLLLSPRLEIDPDLLRRSPGLVDDAVGLASGFRQLLAIVGEELVGFCARGLGLLEVALDLLPTLVEQPAHAREDPLPHEEEEDPERERPDEELLPVGIEVGRLVDLLDVLFGLREEGEDRCHHARLPRPR